MPRSSRHKSHKQHKHREAREYSDEDEVVSYRERVKEKEEVVVRVSKESGSSEKRKLDNGGVAEEYGGSKKRKDRADVGGGDRWNGGDKEVKVEILKIDEKVVKSKVLVDSKSVKTSRRHESSTEKKEVKEIKEVKEANSGLVIVDIEEVKRSSNSSKVESKSKSEKDSSRKEVIVYKDSKDSKDKERAGVDKSSKAQDGTRHEKAVDRVPGKVGLDSEGTRKQSSHLEERSAKPEVGNTEILMKEHLRNLELEKENEKRIRKKRDGSDDKDKYSEDLKDSNGRRLSTKDERHKDEKQKDEKYKDEKYKDEKYKDKYRDDLDRDQRHRGDRVRDDHLDRDHRNREDRVRDDHLDRDHRSREDRTRDDRLDRDHKSREDRVREDHLDRDHRSREDRVREDHLDRDHRNREDRVREDHLDRDHRNREDRTREDHLDRDHRNRDDRVRADHLDRDHRSREDRIRDDRYSKDRIGDRSDVRLSRDESKSSIEDRHKKSKTHNIEHDGSPHILDDRIARYKDYRGKKRSPDDEDGSDLKHRNTKERRYEVEKIVSSGKIEALADRERSHSRVDVDSTLRVNRRKSSPSPGVHLPNDSFRHSSRQSDMKYKDSTSEDKIRATVTSSRENMKPSGVPDRVSESRSTKPLAKPVHKDQNYLSDLPSERSPIADAQVSPLQLKEKSHSSTSIDRRTSNRTPVRRSNDVEETRHRGTGSKDVRDYSTNDDRRSQDWQMDKLQPADDGDTVSVSSSFNRTNHLPTNSSSVLPPPPYRTGSDSPVFSSFDEDTRSKSSNRYKRSSDNLGRGQGNTWKGAPNWSSPVPNGFMPFQQGPPPGGFHLMQQFHGPPMFNVRPSMELNPTGVPYHIPDADRYSGHGRSFGWRNRVDDVCPPHMHGWDGSNGPDWDPNRHMMNDRGWDGNPESWKGQNNGSTMDFPSASWKEDNQQRSLLEEVSSVKPGQRSRSRSVSQAESIEIKVSDDVPPEPVHTDSKQAAPEEITTDPSKTLNKDGFLHVYLSKLDISVDLTHPDVYEQCLSLLDKKGNSTDCNENKDLSKEVRGKARVNFFGTSLKSPLFPKIKESNFQRAMSLYKLQREERQAKFPVRAALGTESKTHPTNAGVNLNPDSTMTDQTGVLVPVIVEEKEELIPTAMDVNMKLFPAVDAKVEDLNMNVLVPAKIEETNMDEPVPAIFDAEADEQNDDPNKLEGEKSILEEVAAEASDFDKDERDNKLVPKSPEVVVDSPNLNINQPGEQVSAIEQVVKMEVEEDVMPTSIVENLESAENNPPQQTLQSASAKDPSADMEIDTLANIPNENKASNDDTICGILGVNDGSEACEELAPMSIDCKSVNLSRIHSPESTH